MYKTYPITVDTMKKVQNNMFTVNTNDLNTPKIIINIKQNGEPVVLTGGVKVRMAIKKPDGKVVFQDCDVIDASEGLCTVVLNTQAFAVEGNHTAELMVYYTEDRVSVTARFSYTAVKGLFDDGTIESSNSFPAFNQIVFDAQTAGKNALEHEQNALLSAQQAKISEQNNNQTVVETLQARSTFPTLNDRLNDFDNKVTGASGVYFPMYTPQMKGATGKVEQDATPILQAILDIAISKGAVYCHIPAGTYRITNKLYLSKNTKIVMDKGARILRDHNAGFFINGRTGDMFSGYNGNGNITIEGGILDGNIKARNKHYNEIGLARGENIVLRDIEILDVRGAHAVDLNSSKNVLIEGCRFKGYDINYTVDGDGASNFREAIQISTHTIDGFSSFGEFDGTPSVNVTVRNNYFGASENLPSYPCGVGNHGHTPGKFIKNIRIYDNTFDGCTYAGIRPFKYENVWIKNNTFNNCEYGVRFTNPDGKGGYDNGIPESGKNVVIEANNFNSSKKRDIYIAAWALNDVVAKFKNVQIINNISEGYTGTANESILVNFCDNVLIQGNTCRTAYRFIMSSYCNNVQIKDNLVNDITTEIVYVNDGDIAENLGKGYTKDYYIVGNRAERGGRTGFLISGLDGVEIHSNILNDITLENASGSSRSSMSLSSSTRNGRVYNNRIRGSLQKYGIEITSSCSNIQTFNNDVVGVTRALLNNATGGFEGTFMYSANGTRYKITVSDAGALVFTAG
ncbi:BppU family phage baseplate upper protein [Peribacillus sp. SIMBA_075]|uniref:BppU family phage baseplate upper protein n=1 Tax=Peribacillus sp. SIMBA_075 TaxID=3085813 RepID=UPI00397E224D